MSGCADRGSVPPPFLGRKNPATFSNKAGDAVRLVALLTSAPEHRRCYSSSAGSPSCPKDGDFAARFKGDQPCLGDALDSRLAQRLAEVAFADRVLQESRLVMVTSAGKLDRAALEHMGQA